MSTDVKKFEIINPSDECYFYSWDPLLAAAATCVVGGGAYPMKAVGGDFEMPLFLFGGVDEWFKEKAGLTFKEYLDANAGHIAQCLETFEYPRKRTSMNNIGGEAKKWAKIMLKKSEKV